MAETEAKPAKPKAKKPTAEEKKPKEHAPRAEKAPKATKKKVTLVVNGKKVPKYELVKHTDKYCIFKKRTGRFSVQTPDKKWVNGEEKVKILMAEGLLKAPKKKTQKAA